MSVIPKEDLAEQVVIARWVPVEERLPEALPNCEGDYYAWSPSYQVRVGTPHRFRTVANVTWDDEKSTPTWRVRGSNFRVDEVTHWLELVSGQFHDSDSLLDRRPKRI